LAGEADEAVPGNSAPRRERELGLIRRLQMKEAVAPAGKARRKRQRAARCDGALLEVGKN